MPSAAFRTQRNGTEFISQLGSAVDGLPSFEPRQRLRGADRITTSICAWLPSFQPFAILGALLLFGT